MRLYTFDLNDDGNPTTFKGFDKDFATAKYIVVVRVIDETEFWCLDTPDINTTELPIFMDGDADSEIIGVYEKR